MKGIIWYYTNKEKGLEQLNRIVEKYKRLGIDGDMRVTTTNISAYFTNGDIWRVVPARDGSRGHACNISYIEYGIPEDLVEVIIKPCTKAFPYTAYNYYYINGM